MISILIPTIPRRRVAFDQLTERLEIQIVNEGLIDFVQLIALYDLKQMSVGMKRNHLMDMTTTEFMVFIDDDDEVHPNYLRIVCSHLKENPETDCVVYDHHCVRVGTNRSSKAIYGIEFEEKQSNPYYNKPAHTCIWRTEVARKTRFEDISFDEDLRWIRLAHRNIGTQTRIEETLYTYRYDPRNSETPHPKGR